MRRSVVLVLILLSASLVAWWWMRDAGLEMPLPTRPVVASSDSVKAATDTGVQAAIKGPSTPSAASSGAMHSVRVATPLPAGSFKEVAPKLQAMAEAGNAQAAYHLSTIYQRCGGWMQRVDKMADRMRELDVEASVHGQSGMSEENQASHRAYLGNKRDEVSARCAPLGMVPRLGDGYGHMHNLQLAAEAGDPKAMIEFARSAIMRYTALDAPGTHHSREPLARAEDIASIRRQAIGYLRRARALGEPAALLELASQYRNGSLFPPDLVRSYAFGLAWLHVGGQSTRTGRSGNFIMSYVQPRLSVTEQQQAEAMARRIEAGFEVHAGDRW